MRKKKIEGKREKGREKGREREGKERGKGGKREETGRKEDSISKTNIEL